MELINNVTQTYIFIIGVLMVTLNGNPLKCGPYLTCDSAFQGCDKVTRDCLDCGLFCNVNPVRACEKVCPEYYNTTFLTTKVASTEVPGTHEDDVVTDYVEPSKQPREDTSAAVFPLGLYIGISVIALLFIVFFIGVLCRFRQFDTRGPGREESSAAEPLLPEGQHHRSEYQLPFPVPESGEFSDTTAHASSSSVDSTPEPTLEQAVDSTSEDTPLKQAVDSTSEDTPLKQAVDSTSEDTPLKQAVDSTSEDTPLKQVVDSTSEDTPLKQVVDSTSDDTPLKQVVDSTSEDTPLKQVKDSTSEETQVKTVVPSNDDTHPKQLQGRESLGYNPHAPNEERSREQLLDVTVTRNEAIRDQDNQSSISTVNLNPSLT